jgi:hypothetical protein
MALVLCWHASDTIVHSGQRGRCHTAGKAQNGLGAMSPNNAFKPKLHRYAVHMAGKACQMASYALQFGLT